MQPAQHTPVPDMINQAINSSGWSAERICVSQGKVELFGVRVDNARGAVDLGAVLGDAVHRTKRVRTRRVGTRYQAVLPPGAKARCLSVEIEDFLSGMSEDGAKARTIINYRRALLLMISAVGDIVVSEINRDHIRAYWETFRWWPKHAGNRSDLKGLSSAEILAIGRKEADAPPKPATKNFHRLVLTAFFTRLDDDKVIDGNPMPKVPRREAYKPEEGRAFTSDELIKIFNPDTYVPWASKYPHRWFVPQLALYSGARVTELCQLKVADVVEEAGVWCLSFQVTPDDDLPANGKVTSRQSIKNAPSIRRIPIAQPILDAGFLDYLAEIKATGHARLFPHLKAGLKRGTNELNGNSYAVGHIYQFGDYLRTNLQMESGVGTHAFRHTISTKLKQAKEELELIATITGHKVDLRVPTLQIRYIHMAPEELRGHQIEALAKFDPGVALPVYQKGQFMERLRPGTKMHP